MSDKVQTLEPNALIEQLKSHPENLVGYVVLTGFIGEVTEEFVRIYPALDLRISYKVANPGKNVILAEPSVPGLASGPTRIIVDGSAKIELVQEGDIAASFLSGGISNQLGTVASMGFASETHAEPGSPPPPPSTQKSPNSACLPCPVKPTA